MCAHGCGLHCWVSCWMAARPLAFTSALVGARRTTVVAACTLVRERAASLVDGRDDASFRGRNHGHRSTEQRCRGRCPARSRREQAARGAQHGAGQVGAGERVERLHGGAAVVHANPILLLFELKAGEEERHLARGRGGGGWRAGGGGRAIAGGGGWCEARGGGPPGDSALWAP